MKVVVWGTGKMAQKVFQHELKNGVEIVSVVDNNEEKEGSLFNEYKVEQPNKVNFDDCDKVLIATTKLNNVTEIKEYLHEQGFSQNSIVELPTGDVMYYLNGGIDEIFDIPKKIVPFKKGPAEIYTTYMGETYKSYNRRVAEGFFDKYCQGEGLDIGYGADIIKPDASGWDLRNGDAQYLESIEDESFDYVYSSHCLEHMVDVRVALKNWFRVVREGGYLIIAIPHRDLYEKRRCLPSKWNTDHKHMFLIGKSEAPDTLDIVEEIRESLIGYDIQYIKCCDYGHTNDNPDTHSDGEYQIEVVIRKMKKPMWEQYGNK